MSELNYVPSWLDSAMTLLEKLNKCIEKIETIVNTVVSVTKTANDALNLAKRNETDINTLYPKTTALETKTAALETKTTTLETDVDAASQEARGARSLAQLALDTGNTAQAIANGKSAKLYLHEITLNTEAYQFKFFSITEESKKYSDKIKNGETFSTTLKPFNCVLTKADSVYLSKSLTLQLSNITLDDKGNSDGTIMFAAYLDNSNQIVTITNLPQWLSASIVGEIVTEL